MTPPPLIARPYRASGAKVGEQLYDEYRGGDVEVAALSDAPVRWPCRDARGGRLVPILNGDLARAVRVESVQAVCHWWGVSRDTVRRWRAALGVARMNEGTVALWKELAPRRLSREARSAGARKSNVTRWQKPAT